MALWKDGVFVADHWRYVGEGEAPSTAGHVIMSLDWWRSMRGIFLPSTAPVGVLLEPGEALASIAEDLPRLSLVALSFPAYTDGRSFSKAQLMRSKYHFDGEIRAVGDVLIDQVNMLLRCGFDTLEVSNSATESALRSGVYWRQQRFYQPSIREEAPAGTRPWLRQRSRVK